MTIEIRLDLDRGGFVLAADLAAPMRGVTALLGPSGCGKTTLLRAVAGLEPASRGLLRVGDEIWQDDARFRPPHERAVGYVFQEASLFRHLSVRGNLRYGLERVAAADRRVDFGRTVALLGLESLLERTPHSLSGGERQRVAIARALLASPRVLLMDEPLAALDRESKAEILPFLETLHRELDIPVLYVSHLPEEVARLADHLVLLEGGRVRAAGPLAEVLTRLDLPLAHRDEALSVVETTVGAFDEHYELALLDFSGGRFAVTRADLPVGQPVRLQILARDVSLTLEHQIGTSILNIFPATVRALAAEGGSQITVALDVGGAPILSRITRRSAEALELAPGRRIFAQIKSVALLG